MNLPFDHERDWQQIDPVTLVNTTVSPHSTLESTILSILANLAAIFEDLDYFA